MMTTTTMMTETAAKIKQTTLSFGPGAEDGHSYECSDFFFFFEYHAIII